MAQQSHVQSYYIESDIFLAISAIESNQISNVFRAASMYNVPRSTLRNRRARRPARCDCEPNLKKLSKIEKGVIIKYILNLDL